MSILITGGAGFIGSHLIELLLRESVGLPIVCLDNFNDYYDPRSKRANIRPFANHPAVTVVEQDLCDREAMTRLLAEHRVQYVVHLAAYAGVHASVQCPWIYEQVNVGGTLALLEAARHVPVQRFLLISSSTVYGLGADMPFREDGKMGIPASPYGATKRAAELLGLTYWTRFQVPVVCLRPFSVYGPRVRPDLAMAIFTDRMARGETVHLYGDGTIQRDFTHVRDICAGLKSALTAPHVEGEEINLGFGSPVSMTEVLGLLERQLGVSATIEYHPGRGEDLPVTFASVDKAKRLLNYRPGVSIAEGVADYCEWYRTHASTSS